MSEVAVIITALFLITWTGISDFQCNREITKLHNRLSDLERRLAARMEESQ